MRQIEFNLNDKNENNAFAMLIANLQAWCVDYHLLTEMRIQRVTVVF